jgi:hypothetical protein
LERIWRRPCYVKRGNTPRANSRDPPASVFANVFFPQDANAKAIEKRRMEIFKRDLIFDLF